MYAIRSYYGFAAVWAPAETSARGAELTTEFREFFRHDRSHVCVPFRSLTCETGHSADLDVIRELYDMAHAMVPQTRNNFV